MSIDVQVENQRAPIKMRQYYPFANIFQGPCMSLSAQAGQDFSDVSSGSKKLPRE